MWENKLIILDMKKFEEDHKHINTEAQIAFALEQKLDEITTQGWEPYHVTDENSEDMLLVWCKRYNPDL